MLQPNGNFIINFFIFIYLSNHNSFKPYGKLVKDIERYLERCVF